MQQSAANSFFYIFFVCSFVMCMFVFFLSFVSSSFNQLLEIYSQQYRNRVSVFNSFSRLSFTFSFPLLHLSLLPLLHLTLLYIWLLVWFFCLAWPSVLTPESLCEFLGVCRPLVFTGLYCSNLDFLGQPPCACNSVPVIQFNSLYYQKF